MLRLSVGGLVVSLVCMQVIAESWEHSGVLPYIEKLYVRSAPLDVCLEDVLVEPLLQFTR